MTYDPSLDDDDAELDPDEDMAEAQDEERAADQDLPHALYEGERYCWTCPRCDNFHMAEEEVRGTVVQCDDCEERYFVPS